MRVSAQIKINQTQLDLIDEASMFTDTAAKIVDSAIEKSGSYVITISNEEIEDLLGYIAACGNHEESGKKQRKWDELYEKLEKYENELNRTEEKLKKNAGKEGLEHYVIEIAVKDREVKRGEGQTWRQILIRADQSLYLLAREITKAYNFYFDHCFGFYDNLERYNQSLRAYELFVDIGEEPLKAEKGVKKTKISESFKSAGDKMLFLFDYGDEWEFIVELKDVCRYKTGFKPILLDYHGKAPLQYPPEEDLG